MLVPVLGWSLSLLHIHLRGCPGMGTRWSARAIPCLFQRPVRVSSDYKHSGCRHKNYLNFKAGELLSPTCTVERNCTHAVIARHPLALKGGTAQREWETYYGGWMQHKDKNVIYFRFESLIGSGCTQKTANQEVVKRTLERLRSRSRPQHEVNETVWDFWNYSY